MKKRILICSALFLSLCAGFTSYGKAVDVNTAKTIGSNYLISNGVHGVNGPSDLVITYTASAKIASGIVDDYYVFNINGGNGFVMVSADDNIIPVLAYSSESSFDIEKIAPTTKKWIEGYANQITYVIEHNLPAQAGTSTQWQNLLSGKRESAARTTVVTPLLTTTWDQFPQTGVAGNYNGLCPSNTSGRAVTGCVATAMSQIMKFWKWPTVGNGYHTYNPAGYATQSVDFGNSVYNWTAMPNALTSGNNIPLETILWHAGVSVDMNYGPSSGTGSGSYVTELESPIQNCAEFALKTYFHYKHSLKGYVRFGITGGPGPIATASWIAMLKAEFDAGRPVLYTGYSTTDGGHCWVGDGYNASNFIHFNWGWSGYSNGYFSVDALTPTALGGGNFNSDQSAVIGIQPDAIAANTGNIKMLSHVDCQVNSPIGYAPMPTVTAKILNGGTTQFKGDIALQVFDTLNTLMGTLQTITGQTINAGDSSALLTFTPAIQSFFMIPGPCIFHVLYKPTGSNTWTMVGDNGTFINYNMIVVTNSNGVTLYDNINLTPSSTTVTQHNPLSITTKVANFNNSNWRGTLEAVMINTGDLSTFVIQQVTGCTINFKTYNTYTFATTNVNAAPGNYVLAIEHQTNGTGSFTVTGSDFYENPIFMKVVRNVGVLEPASVENDVAIYPNPANETLYIAPLGIDLSSVRITDMQGREVFTTGASAADQTIKVNTTSFAPGMYLVQLQAGNDVATKKIVITK